MAHLHHASTSTSVLMCAGQSSRAPGIRSRPRKGRAGDANDERIPTMRAYALLLLLLAPSIALAQTVTGVLPDEELRAIPAGPRR